MIDKIRNTLLRRLVLVLYLLVAVPLVLVLSLVVHPLEHAIRSVWHEAVPDIIQENRHFIRMVRLTWR